jgi:hypothetical protein
MYKTVSPFGEKQGNISGDRTYWIVDFNIEAKRTFCQNILKEIERIICGRAYKFSAMFPQARPTLTLVQKLIVCAKFTERRMQTAFTA